MKVLYIKSELKKPEISLSQEEIIKLPKRIYLAYTVQYKESAQIIRKQLEANNIKVTGFQQVLGCSKLNTRDPILLIGTGRFHAFNLFLQSPIIYTLENNRLKQISASEIESLKNKRKSALIKYLNANNIGILVSAKPGQENITQAIKLKRQLENKGKKAHIFISNNIDISQFENFSIDSWVNTACIGLSYDNPSIINYSEIK